MQEGERELGIIAKKLVVNFKKGQGPKGGGASGLRVSREAQSSL